MAEYNRSLEAFVSRFEPNTQEIYLIILQMSRFLRELADFETASTPQFRHPPLRGANKELEALSLKGELYRLGYDILHDESQ